MVSQGTQGVGGAVQVVDESIGQQVAGYGTAVGNATQYGLDTDSAINGVVQGVTNAGIVAQGGDVSRVVQGQVPVMTVNEVANIPGATIVALVP